MDSNIDHVKKEVQDLYKSLSPVVKDVVHKRSKEIDSIIAKIKKDASTLTNREIQDYMLQLSIEVYYFAEDKDLSVMKQECADALLKESQATVFNGTVGTQNARTNQSIIDTIDKQVMVTLQKAISNMMKTKLDEAHRMVAVLSNILISRNAENKLKGAAEGGHNSINNRVPETSTEF